MVRMASHEWNDDPITTSSDDQFGRNAYARRTANLIADCHSWSTSMVFGLTGPWGSGKSSMLKMVIEELTTDHRKWRVARFTPWATNNVADMMGEFYASIAEALPPRRGQAARNALGNLAHIAAPALSAIPVAGGALSGATKSGAEWLKRSPSWHSAFATAAREMEALRQPVLVVADDIDRLQTDELLAFLKVVRLLGRFDGVQYLLAYDEATLFRALQSANLVEDQSGAQRFIEKIVQYPLAIPPLLEHQIVARLNQGLSEALIADGRTSSEPARMQNIAEVFRNQLTTPRAIDRFLAQVRHHLPMFEPGEINETDVVFLTLIRVAFPTVYGQIPKHRAALLSGHTGELQPGGRGIDFIRFESDELLDGLTVVDRRECRKVLVELFPKLKRQNEFEFTSGPRRTRVCDEEYFDRYFAMGVPAHDISDALVRRAVDLASSGDQAALYDLIEHSEPAKAYLVVSKGSAYTRTLTINDRPPKLASVLAVLSQRVPDDTSTIFSVHDRIVDWCATQIATVPTTSAASAVFRVLEPLALSLALHLWEKTVREMGQPNPLWATAVDSDLCEKAVTAFVEHLHSGDAADAGANAPYWAHFLIRRGRTTELKGRIAEALATGPATTADLAARTVSVLTTIGPNSVTRMDNVDGDLWRQLAPPGADPVYYLTVDETVNRTDITWANRRRFASGRVPIPVDLP